MEQPRILIVSDELNFANAVTARCLSELSVPAFTIKKSGQCGRDSFDLAITGGLNGSAASVLEKLSRSGRPVVHVSQVNRSGHKYPGVVGIPEVPGWIDLLAPIVREVLERVRIEADVARLAEKNSQLERQAVLGRYMIEARHNLSNALTSILGNSDLILLDEDQLPGTVKAQVETIRNMSMRVNEIMHRFSSLQKEMQLVEQQSQKKSGA